MSREEDLKRSAEWDAHARREAESHRKSAQMAKDAEALEKKMHVTHHEVKLFSDEYHLRQKSVENFFHPVSHLREVGSQNTLSATPPDVLARMQKKKQESSRAYQYSESQNNAPINRIARDIQPAFTVAAASFTAPEALVGTGITAAVVNKGGIPFVTGYGKNVIDQIDASREKSGADRIDPSWAGMAKIKQSDAVIEGIGKVYDGLLPKGMSLAATAATKTALGEMVYVSKEATKFALSDGKEGQVTLGGMAGAGVQAVSGVASKHLLGKTFDGSRVEHFSEHAQQKFGMKLEPSSADLGIKANDSQKWIEEKLKKLGVPEMGHPVQDLFKMPARKPDDHSSKATQDHDFNALYTAAASKNPDTMKTAMTNIANSDFGQKFKSETKDTVQAINQQEALAEVEQKRVQTLTIASPTRRMRM